MRSAAPGDERDHRPPVAITAAPSPGGAGRRSVWRRPSIVARLFEDGVSGFPAHHPYVRRFWTAAIGPGGVADLLRLMTAAVKRQPIPYPEYLHLLISAGLVVWSPEIAWVRRSVPPLGGAQLRRIPPALRAEHQVEVASFFGTGEGTGNPR